MTLSTPPLRFSVSLAIKTAAILEFKAQCHLAGAIASVFCCLHAGDFSECRRGHIRRRRGVIQMIRQVPTSVAMSRPCRSAAHEPSRAHNSTSQTIDPGNMLFTKIPRRKNPWESLTYYSAGH